MRNKSLTVSRYLVGLVVLALSLVCGHADAMRIPAAHSVLQGYGVTKGYTYEGLGATRAGILNSQLTLANQQGMVRSGHIATDDLRKLKLAFANFATVTMLPDEQTQGVETLTASIEYPAQSGKFTAVTFNGGYTSVTIPAGGVAFSDWITPPGLIGINTKVDIRYWSNNPTGFFFYSARDAANDDLAAFSGSQVDQTMGGTITNQNSNSGRPTALIGMTTKASVITIGDSIDWGQTDDSTIADFRKGEVARNFPTTLAFLNVSSPALAAADIVAKSPGRKQFYYLASHVISELGVNDFYPGNKTSAQVTTALVSQFALFPPNAAIIQGTITPETTSTDSWATTGMQTISTCSGACLNSNANRITFNTSLRSGSIGSLRGFFEYVWLVESAHDSGLWQVDGTAFKYTPDGIHPSVFGYQAATVGTNMGQIFR